MAGIIYVTQSPLNIAATTDYKTVVTQALVVGSVTLNYSTAVTQAALNVAAITAYRAQITQACLNVWVIRCSSTSYVPPAPTGLITLTATPGATGQQWVDLAWTPLPGFTYSLQRGTTPGVYPTTILAGSSLTSVRDSSVAFNTQYYYLLTGLNACGDTTASNEATGAPGCTLPASPLKLHATANGAVIELLWNSAAGATSYSIYRGTTAGAETLLVAGVTATTYSDSTAVGGTTYFYVIFAVNSCGVSGTSNTADAKTSCCTVYSDDGDCGNTAYSTGPDCETDWVSQGC